MKVQLFGGGHYVTRGGTRIDLSPTQQIIFVDTTVEGVVTHSLQPELLQGLEVDEVSVHVTNNGQPSRPVFSLGGSPIVSLSGASTAITP